MRNRHHENSTLKYFNVQSQFINLEHRREIDRVFTSAETSDLLVIDCRAAPLCTNDLWNLDLFIDLFDKVSGGDLLRKFGVPLTVICPVNHETDSVEQLRILSDALYDHCAWVVVKNEAHARAAPVEASH